MIFLRRIDVMEEQEKKEVASKFHEVLIGVFVVLVLLAATPIYLGVLVGIFWRVFRFVVSL
jgi:hypothetical protein